MSLQVKQHDNSLVTFDDSIQYKLDQYANSLKEWNGLNLIARSTENDIFGWHISDALALYNLLKDEEHPIIDFGSGGGVLGISLHCAKIHNIHLVERSKSKAMFLKDILKFDNVHANYAFDHSCTVIVRGVCDIDTILNLINAKNGKIKQLIMLKAVDLRAELKKAKQNWNFHLETYARKARAHGKILVISDINLI